MESSRLVIKLMSPALADGFFTTGPPGKSYLLLYQALDRVPTSSFCTWMPICPLVKGTIILFPLNFLAILVKKNQQTIEIWVYSRLSILFHWSMCLSFSHTIPTFMLDNILPDLTDVTVQLVFKSGSRNPPTSFFVKIVLALLDPLHFPTNFIFNFLFFF